MSQTKTIIVHQALGHTWEESDEYQGYIPEDSNWETVVAEFTKKRHGIDTPMQLRLHKDGSPLTVRVYEYKAAGEILPLSDKTTSRSAQFVLCEVIHASKKVIIHI